MVRVLISTISEIAKTTDLNTAINNLKTPFGVTEDYHFHQKRTSSIIGHLMLQKLLSEANLGQGVMRTLHRSRYGKIQVHAEVDFNISHSADKVVAVFADQPVIGVDIEKIRRFDWHACRDLFTATDWDTICSSNDPDKTFFEFWTKKESLLKAYGLGLQIPMNQVAIDHYRGRIENTPMVGYFKEIEISGYICYVCARHKVVDLRIETFTL